MSHPLCNPYASGNHSSPQGQGGLSSVQVDSQRASSTSGPGSRFSFSGTSSVTSANSWGIFPSLLPQTVSYRPGQSRALIDKNMSVDMHISRARNGVRLLEKPMDQPIDSRLTRIQRECLDSETGMVSYPQAMSSTSASLGHRDPGVESGSSSSDWSPNYVRPTAAEPPEFYLPPASSNYSRNVDDRFIVSSDRECVTPSLSGVGHFEHPLSDKPAALTESSQYKYTSESDSDILLHFGLSEEDLEHLIAYPEGHITPGNLPFILRQIRIEKTKRATTAAPSTPCPEPQPASSASGTDSERTDGCTEGAGDETGGIGRKRENCGGTGSVLPIETCARSGHIREPPPKNTTEVKSSALGVSRDQPSSDSSLSSWHSVAPPRDDETQLQTQPNPSSQAIPIPVSLPDADFRGVESEASKPVPLEDPEAETRPPSTCHCGVHPSRPDLVLVDGTSGNVDQSRSEAQESTVVEQIKKQQQQKQNEEKQPVSQTRPDILPSVFSATKSVSSTSHILIITGAVQQLPFLTVGPPPTVSRPALPQPIPDLPDLIHPPLPTSNRQPLAKVSVSKGLPTAAMTHGGAAAAPKIFPHTCCLCNRRCLHMKDWVSHLNSSLHLENCKPPRKSAAGKDAESSTSSRTSQYRKKSLSESRSPSRSPIPRGRHRSEDSREKPGSRSRSPHSARYSRRSHSRSLERRPSSRHRSRSRSLERRPSCRHRSRSRSLERRPSSRHRSRSRSLERRPSSRHRSRSRSLERRWLQRRREERRSSTRRRDDRRSTRSRERRSSPRRTDERRSAHRRSNRRRSDRREELSSKKNSAEELLKNSAFHLLSNQSDFEALVNNLAPIVLAKLTKSSSSSSSSSMSSYSSSSSPRAKKELIKKPSKANPSLQKSETGSSTTTKVSPTSTLSLVGDAEPPESAQTGGEVVEPVGKPTAPEAALKKSQSKESRPVQTPPPPLWRSTFSESESTARGPEAVASVTPPTVVENIGKHLPRDRIRVKFDMLRREYRVKK